VIHGGHRRQARCRRTAEHRPGRRIIIAGRLVVVRRGLGQSLTRVQLPIGGARQILFVRRT
jgi:hypothetical protein